MKQLLITVLLLTGVAFATAEVKPFKVEKKYFLTYDKNTTCLVRHFKIYKDPKWVAKIEVRSGKTVYFSSPKSMFEFYFQPDRWFELGAKTPDDIAAITVTDFNTLDAINARSAFYVYGSTQISPAGDDLPAFSTKEDAEAFAAKYKGKRVLRFSEIHNSLIRLINGRI